MWGGTGLCWGCRGTWGCARLRLSGWLTFPTRKYWTLSSFWKSGIQGAFSITDTWPGLPAVIDAAFQDVLTKRVFFFAGELCPCCCWGPGVSCGMRSLALPWQPWGQLMPMLSPACRSAVLGIFWQEHAGSPGDREAGHREGSRPHLGGPAAGPWQSAALQWGELLEVSGWDSHAGACQLPLRGAGTQESWQPSAWLCSPRRLDVKVQRVDKGYPRATDDVFTGVPLDARNVFLYQGEWGPGGRGLCGHHRATVSLPRAEAAPPRLARGRGCTVGSSPEAGHAISPSGSLWWGCRAPARAICGGRIPVCLRHLGSCQDGFLHGRPPTDSPFPSAPSSPRQVPLLPGQLLLENDAALPGGPGGLRQVRHPAVPPALRVQSAGRLRPARCSLPVTPNSQASVSQPDSPGHQGLCSLVAVGQPSPRWGLCCLPSRKGQGNRGLPLRSCPARGAPAGEQDSHRSRHRATPASAGSAAQRNLPGANHTRICNDFVFFLSQPCQVGLGFAGSWHPGTRLGGGGSGGLPCSCPLPALPTSICPFLIKTILWTQPPSALPGLGHRSPPG